MKINYAISKKEKSVVKNKSKKKMKEAYVVDAVPFSFLENIPTSRKETRGRTD
jgi:hypothetical protein